MLHAAPRRRDPLIDTGVSYVAALIRCYALRKGYALHRARDTSYHPRSTSARHDGNTAFSEGAFNGRVTILADIDPELVS